MAHFIWNNKSVLSSPSLLYTVDDLHIVISNHRPHTDTSQTDKLFETSSCIHRRRIKAAALLKCPWARHPIPMSTRGCYFWDEALLSKARKNHRQNNCIRKCHLSLGLLLFPPKRNGVELIMMWTDVFMSVHCLYCIQTSGGEIKRAPAACVGGPACRNQKTSYKKAQGTTNFLTI